MNQEFENYWRDDQNWSGSIYFCKNDPRLVVPKRTRALGWTINFGHSKSTFALLSMIILPAMIAGAILGITICVITHR